MNVKDQLNTFLTFLEITTFCFSCHVTQLTLETGYVTSNVIGGTTVGMMETVVMYL